MEEKKKGGEGETSSLINFILIGAVIVIAILLTIFFWPARTIAPSAEVEGGQIVDETAETNNGALRVVQPVMSGDYKYEFKGVKWTFDTTSPEVAGTNQTWLKMEFADFTRNGNAIVFGTPYKLGVHPGVCKQLDFIDTSSEEGIPFSYARCEGEGVVQDFVVLQENEQIIVKMNETKGPSNPSGQTAPAVWKDWYKVDVTSIVQ